jgi:hypothetical protein
MQRFTFKVEGLPCDKAIEKVKHTASTNPAIKKCLGTGLEVQRIDDCNAVVTLDYVVER